jgi:N-acetylmuramoyl-L-alanine amidase
MIWVARSRTTAASLSALLCAGTMQVHAQVPATAAVAAVAVAPAETLFADASAKEIAVRKALAADERQPTMLKAVRTVVADYENVVRHYPTSGFCDDALWRAATLSRDAFEAFGEARERAAALRLFALLASGYPSSRLAKQTSEPIAWLTAHSPKAVPSATASAPVVEAPPPARSLPVSAGPPSMPTPPSSGTSAAAPRLVVIKAIRRAVLADVVRVVIELDSEVTFHDERIEGPNRVFVDLPSTRANPSLIDQTLRFDADTDIVRQIRIGRHPNSTTRVVLEAAGVSSYSVYPLYSPFRLVIDCLRAAPAVASTTSIQPKLAAGIDLPGHTEAAQPAVLPGRPAWAGTLRRSPVAPPLLTARRVRWILPLPSAADPALPRVAGSAAVITNVSALPSKPAPAAATPLPAGEPSHNLAGGLSIARQLGLGVSRIVIDPGHGGHDPGARGAGVSEAELVLDVALRLEKLLAKLPGVEVVLTRRENDFVSLQERTAIANRESADLFLSIHANASSVPAARGVETYFLNFASNQNAAAVAARENATSEQTMGALQDVVKAIALNSKVDESRDFATYVQREMLESLRGANKTVKDLGVKQAPFVVLIGAAMPSVLAEISFVTNPQEARLLKASNYRQRIADALFEGIRKYQAALKNAPSLAQQQD